MVENDFFIVDKNKEDLLSHINKRGFMLESKVLAILHKICSERFRDTTSWEIRQSKVIDFRSERVEIDSFLIRKKYCMILESKRTVYDWIFPKDERNSIHLVKISKRGVEVDLNCIIPYTNYTRFDLAIKFEPDRKLTDKQDVNTAYKDIHQKVLKILFKTEAMIHLLVGERNIGKRTFDELNLLPVIITNARLWTLECDESYMDGSADLIKFPIIKEVPFVAYNFSQVLKWDLDQQKVKEAYDTELKTVFIVNVRKLKAFIECVDDLAVFQDSNHKKTFKSP